MDRALRAPVSDDNRSGATLERVVLADGSRVVVKRFDPAVRDRERAALPWWLHQAERALETGLV
jgi:hypothetical protein